MRLAPPAVPVPLHERVDQNRERGGRPSATGTLAASPATGLVATTASTPAGPGMARRSDEQTATACFRCSPVSSTDGSVLSTDLLQLVERGAPTGLDVDALSVFLRLGFFVGDDTPFASIRAVLPPRPGIATARLSRPAAVRGYIDLVRQAIRRRLPTAPFVLPLSGGRDSRHLLYELLDAGCPPGRCVTCATSPARNEDENRAPAVGSESGCPRRLDQPRDRSKSTRKIFGRISAPKNMRSSDARDHLGPTADVRRIAATCCLIVQHADPALLPCFPAATPRRRHFLLQVAAMSSPSGLSRGWWRRACP